MFNRRARRDRREFLGISLCGLGGLGGSNDFFTRSLAGPWTAFTPRKLLSPGQAWGLQCAYSRAAKSREPVKNTHVQPQSSQRSPRILRVRSAASAVSALIVLCQIRSGGLFRNDINSFNHSGRSSKNNAVTISRIQFRTCGNVGSGFVPRWRSRWRNVNVKAASTA
jgi:hypothetical protein